MRKLTQAEEEAYIRAQGVRCPWCGAEETEGGPVDIDAGTATQESSCLACSAEWTDVYRLVGIDYESEHEEAI